MSSKALAILFAVLVACCWGLYGPTLSKSRSPTGEWGPYKPYVFIGVAYLVIAIAGGAVMMKLGGVIGLPTDNFDYSGDASRASKWGFLAGSLGAFGAMFLTFAVVKTKGNPALVMPVVFGGAVTVNAIASFVSMQDRTGVNPLLWLGMAITAVGICLVAAYTPHGSHPKKKEPVAVEQTAAEQPSGSGELASEPV